MELINFDKSTLLIKSFFELNNLWNFISSDSNIYIGGSLPFMCLSNYIDNIINLQVGDIDIYTKNCPLLFRNLNKKFVLKNIIKTGVNVKFNIELCQIPIQIITSPFDNFKDETKKKTKKIKVLEEIHKILTDIPEILIVKHEDLMDNTLSKDNYNL